MKFFWLLAKLRYVSIIAVISSFIASAIMFFIGGRKVYKAAYYLLTGTKPEWAPAKMVPGDTATILILASLDSFLIALALLYFGYGIYALVIDPESSAGTKAPPWIVPKGITDLKETLAHVIIIVLFVLFLDELWTRLNDLTWEFLVLPVSITLLALAVKLMGLTNRQPH